MLTEHGIEYRLEEVLPGRSNLIACIKGKTDRGICLEAHADTVGTDGMTIKPFTPEIKNGMLYGRGSCDTKASLASMLHAVCSIKKSGQTPPTDVYFVAAVDEEFMCRGAKHLMKTGFMTGSAVIGEPTSLAIVTACKGVARFRVSAKGKAAHSSRPDEGINAIYSMSKLMSLIDNELCTDYRKTVHPLLGSPTVNPGVICGGSLVNIVPDECHADIDRRLLPGETYDKVTAEITQLAENHGIDGISVSEQLLYDEAMETDTDSDVVKCLRGIAKKMGLDDKPYGVGYCCDGTKFSRAGIPSVVLGPGDIKYAHSACEFVPIEECALASDIYQRLCMSAEIG